MDSRFTRGLSWSSIAQRENKKIYLRQRPCQKPPFFINFFFKYINKQNTLPFFFSSFAFLIPATVATFALWILMKITDSHWIRTSYGLACNDWLQDAPLEEEKPEVLDLTRKFLWDYTETSVKINYFICTYKINHHKYSHPNITSLNLSEHIVTVILITVSIIYPKTIERLVQS